MISWAGWPDGSVRPVEGSARHQRPNGSLRPSKERGTGRFMLFAKRDRRIKRILVVEDEPLVAFDNEYMLSDAGYEVVATVDNLESAREVIEAQDLDLVLTDIKLAGEGDGTGVARIARTKGVPVLFVTGECPADAKSLGVGCLAKPYSEKVLKSALSALDDMLQGKTLKKLPPQLTLHAQAA